MFGRYPGPERITRAAGCAVWDVAGREYLDTTMALGAVGLGYAHPRVTAAAEAAVRHGTVGPLPPALEREVAARVAAVVPGGEAVRFFKSGAEAVQAAVRTARVFTGRERVIHCGYHGWLDWCQNVAGVPAAISDLRREVRFNDREDLKNTVDAFGPVAAVVIEPVIDTWPDPDWLTDARNLASRTGAVLVFDEIKTGFRIALGGAAERFGVVPDLAVYGKAMGNGFPIAALVGSAPVMEAVTRTWISSTLATESVSLAAAAAVLDVYDTENVVGHLETIGTRFLTGLTGLKRAHDAIVAGVRGIPQMCYLEFHDDQAGALLASTAAANGVLFKRNAYNFVSLAHTPSIVETILERLDNALSAMEGAC